MGKDSELKAAEKCDGFRDAAMWEQTEGKGCSVWWRGKKSPGKQAWQSLVQFLGYLSPAKWPRSSRDGPLPWLPLAPWPMSLSPFIVSNHRHLIKAPPGHCDHSTPPPPPHPSHPLNNHFSGQCCRVPGKPLLSAPGVRTAPRESSLPHMRVGTQSWHFSAARSTLLWITT